MKKIVVIIFSIFMIPFVKANDEVNLYLFHADYCGFCRAEREFLSKYLKNEPNVHLYEYEVQSEENYNKYLEVKELMNVTEEGIPLLFVGDKYLVGYSEEEIKELIKEAKTTAYEDKVGEKLLGTKPNIEKPQNEESQNEEPQNEEQDNEEENNTLTEENKVHIIDKKIIVIICVGLILGAITVLLMNKNKKTINN